MSTMPRYTRSESSDDPMLMFVRETDGIVITLRRDPGNVNHGYVLKMANRTGEIKHVNMKEDRISVLETVQDFMDETWGEEE